MTDQDSQRVLEELRDQFLRVARAKPQRSSRGQPRRTALVATATLLLALPAGFAIAQVTDTDPGVPASECPDANAALEKAGLPVPDEYAPGCPTAQDINERRGLTEAPPPAVLQEAAKKGLIHEGQDPATYPPEVRDAISQWEAQHQAEK